MNILVYKAKNTLVETKNKVVHRTKKLRIRHFDKFIFIHINKTGGSSIVKALDLFLEHKTALQKIDELGREKWDKSFTFAFVRNPWDKVVSHYHYRVKTNQTDLRVNPIDFKDWVRLTYGQKDPRYFDKPIMFMPQSDWITDSNGSIIVDFVGRFEKLNSDFQKVCERIGKKHIVLPHVKSSKRGNYREYYNETTIELVGEYFKKDIEAFGYKF